MYKYLSILFFIFWAKAPVKAQSSLVFLNGQVKKVTVLDTAGKYVKTYDSTALWRKHKRFHKRNLFSLLNYNNNDHIYYRQDSVFGNALSMEQMRNYINGEQEAYAYYHAPISFGIGLAFGAGSAFLGNIISAAFIPIGALLPCSFIEFDIPKITHDNIPIHDKVYQNDNAYLAGYIHRVHKKRIKNVFWGGLTGLAITVPILFIVSHNNK